MSDINLERMRLLVKISQLYYEDGLNQQDIAQRFGISRPHVSRMLTSARSEGIVHISIKNPFSAEQEVERQLIKLFGIHDALVVNTSEADERSSYLQLGRTCAALLESVLKDQDIVGVMAGRAIASLGEELNYFPRTGLQLVPLVGGWGSEGADWHANSNVSKLAEKLKAKYWLLHAPAVVASPETKELLVNEPEISRVLQLAQRSSIAIVGIGQVSDKATIMESGYFSEEDLTSVQNGHAAANLCASFLDIQGNVIDFPAKNRMIGTTAPELRGIPNVIAIAGGLEKVQAITATLRGKWVDMLVTDLATAQAVIEFHKNN
ncbi:sugar-binding transcriptional regulator [Paenibacillus sp. UNC451MF]|uniref:sugar-binding transcriptional regulator n=1 Tax=Paenibacillus sp. UNC451MF TaxID=1449063 RepID=UPI00048A9F87|nr:sugar-binding transcriptional regulator [Paenibacillus sp. UNC451MF]